MRRGAARAHRGRARRWANLAAVIAALLLDFDGLLYDTETAAYAVWTELYAAHGQQLELAQWVRESIGRPPGQATFDPRVQLQELTGETIAPAEVERFRERVRAQHLPDRLMPGAAALLDGARARGLRTAIVTSNFRANVEAHLARAGCAFPFDAIVTADGDPTRGKPRPDLYLEALATLGGLPAADAIAFEDSPNGIAAAHAAGLRCVGVPNDITRGAPGLERADLTVDSLADVDLDTLAALV